MTNSPVTVTLDTQSNLIKAWWKKLPTKTFDLKEPNLEKRVFGIPLSESIMYACSSISYTDSRGQGKSYGVIPTVIAKCGHFLKDHGLSVEGIFRISGNAKRIAQLQAAFDEPDVYGANLAWEGYTTHDAANVMRRFLNHLPEPVIPLDFYREFRQVMEIYQDTEERLSAFQKLISDLPLWHQYLLSYLLDMLGLFALNSDVTRMDISALSAVFVPGILSHPDDELNPAGYKKSQLVLEFLIAHQAKFAAPPSFLPENQTLVVRYSRNTQVSQSASSNRKGSQDQRTMSQSRLDLDPPSVPLPLPSLPSSSRSTPTRKSHNLRRANTTPAKRRAAETDSELPAHTSSSQTFVPLERKASRWKTIRKVPAEHHD